MQFCFDVLRMNKIGHLLVMLKTTHVAELIQLHVKAVRLVLFQIFASRSQRHQLGNFLKVIELAKQRADYTIFE